MTVLLFMCQCLYHLESHKFNKLNFKNKSLNKETSFLKYKLCASVRGGLVPDDNAFVFVILD